MLGVTSRSDSSPSYKGHGGGSGHGSSGSSGNRGSSGNTDSWPVPAVYKVELAVYIILGVAYIVQIGLIARYSGRVGSMTPFLVAALALLLLVGIQAVAAVRLRVNLDLQLWYKLLRLIDFLYAIEIGLRHTAFFLLIHQRGRLLQTGTIMAHLWKRLLDWILVVAACLIYITYAAIATTVNFNQSLSPETRRNYAKAIPGLAHTITAMVIILSINVIVSTWAVYSASRKTKSVDLVIRKLLYTAGPAFLIFAIQYTAFDIYSTKWTFTGTSAKVIEVVHIIVDGLCRLVVYAALISVMTLPVVWVITTVYAPLKTAEVDYPRHSYNPSNGQYQPPTPSPAPPPPPPGAAQPWAIPNAPYQYNPQPQPYQPYPQQYQQQYSPPFTIPPNGQPSAVHAPPQHPPPSS